VTHANGLLNAKAVRIVLANNVKPTLMEDLKHLEANVRKCQDAAPEAAEAAGVTTAAVNQRVVAVVAVQNQISHQEVELLEILTQMVGQVNAKTPVKVMVHGVSEPD